MPLECVLDLIDGTPVAALVGSVDLASVPAMRDRLVQLVTDHAGTTVVVDLDGVIAIDDAGLGILLGLAGRARELGGDLRVVCSPGRLRDRLARTGADRAVTVSDRV